MQTTSLVSESIDQQLISPEFIDNPYPVYSRLREADPVYYCEVWGVWVLTRFEDTTSILRDTKRFSSAGRFSRLLDQLPDEVQPDVAALRQHYSEGLIVSDPPDHTRLRNLVRDSFSPRTIQAIRPRVESIVEDLIDRIESSGTFDVIKDLAYPLPVTVICEILGIPPNDRDRFMTWTEEMSGLQAAGGAKADSARRAARAVVEIEDYFRGICAERRRQPRGDLMSLMSEAQEAGDKLSEEELVNMCTTFLIAGHETTKSLIGNAIWTLLHHPAAMQELKSDPTLMPTAIEEFLRYESPIQRAWRRVTEDVELGGHRIRAGELVFLMLGAANRDPGQFQNPEQLDLRRKDNRHVAFGYGTHFCLGAPLARLEAPIAIGSVLRRLKNLRQERPIEWVGSIHVRGPKSLHVGFGN